MVLDNFSIEVLEIPDFGRALDMLKSDVTKALESALYVEGERMMTTSKLECPVDTGTLRSSGHVAPPHTDIMGHTVTVSLGYGGAAADYALRVHEDLNMHHTVGKAKFLEDPVREAVNSGRAGMRVEQQLRAALR